MAEAITIACPECDKKLTVAAAAVGKKVRCKGCEHVFVIEAPAAKKAAAPAGKAAAKKKPPDAKAAPAKAAKPKAADDDEDANPYGVTALDTAPRCPDCAAEMESEDAIICLHCGYNTQTRQKVEARAVEEQTGMTWFLWLLPGIACAIVTLVLVGFDLWYSLGINALFTDPDAWYLFMASTPFKIWCVWAPTVPVMVGCTAFAVKRLILNPRPPERVKRKPKKEE